MRRLLTPAGRVALRRVLGKDLALALACALGIVAVLAGTAPGRADATPSRPTPYARAMAAANASDDSLTLRKTLTRTYYADGEEQTDTRDVTVTVDKHTDLQSRERISIAWSGAHPSGGRVPNPFGENGMGQEYPVVVLECRGRDDASLPAAQRLSQRTCWTATSGQRSQSASANQAVWLKDARADAADLAEVSGIDRADVPAGCPIQDGTAYHITPFVAASKSGGSGTVYPACSTDTMPPEATAASVDPPNEVAAFTGVDGKGGVNVEVRTSIENESLGCSASVPCSLVVIPIMGISCSVKYGPCNSTGFYEPGSQSDGTMAAAAVSPLYWWSASNWDQRFVIPLDFAPPPNTCSLLGSGSPVPFYGSELLSQAALQWAPAYCLNSKRFNWQFNTMPDDAALAQMNAGGSIAAEVTGRGSDPSASVAFAPTAVSGWGIGFAIDKPGNAGEQTALRLNPRLLAKLMTESYPGSNMVREGHPGLGDNPLSLNLDPEFQALNPGLDDSRFTEAASTLMSLSGGSDVIRQLTSYIAADPDATAFLKGQPDPWGMKVNPFYKGVALPVATWPLLDTWTPTATGSDCLDSNRAPYMPRIAAPVSDMRLISTALLLNWPQVATKCTYLGAGQFKIGRQDPQGLGNRFMLGLVTLADARRYGLNVAELQTKPRTGGAKDVASATFVAPSDASFAAAVGLMRQSGKLQPFTLAVKDVRSSATAYPGTMVVHTAAKTRGGLSSANARIVADFISVATSEGQRVGRGNGELPTGYLPLTDSGATRKLLIAARQARAAILAPAAATSGTPTATASASASASPTPAGGGRGTGTGPVAPVAAPGAATPTAAAPSAAAPVLQAGSTYKTAAVSSRLGGGLLPLLLLAGLAAGLVTALTRIALRLKGLR